MQQEINAQKVLLIDRSFDGEETRVAVVKDGVLEDFDHELASKRLKKGNVYLAQVTRVEAALQAAFLEFGDKKQGFLALSEIHPQYYQHKNKEHASQRFSQHSAHDAVIGEVVPTSLENNLNEEDVDIELKVVRPKSTTVRIQDVIKKGQILLVQVVKDARASKGAALTTYISLAGRFLVFMPNTEGKVKISRKITDKEERKHLIEISESLDVPEGMSVILRTAVLGRTPRELKRDYDRLMRVWKKVEELTKRSKVVPSLLCEENDLIYRAFRDLYSNDIEEIWVESKEIFKKAQDIIKIFMPTHRNRIKLYQDIACGLFEKYQVETSILDLYHSHVGLPSGGYLVINQTEALVAIDVNSGKSTKERAMEETAFKTNLEAARSIGRQLRLRDLSGLVVIDFIDMPSSRYSQVEKALGESLKLDRARIQAGKISQFGLLEMSRQRLRQSLFESMTHTCSLCSGHGYVLSESACVIRILRQIARHVHRMTPMSQLHVDLALETGAIISNQYRGYLAELEATLKINIQLNMQVGHSLESAEFTVIPGAVLSATVSGSGQEGVSEVAMTTSTSTSSCSSSGQRKKIPQEKGPKTTSIPVSIELCVKDQEKNQASEPGEASEVEPNTRTAPPVSVSPIKKRRKRAQRTAAHSVPIAKPSPQEEPPSAQDISSNVPGTAQEIASHLGVFDSTIRIFSQPSVLKDKEEGDLESSLVLPEQEAELPESEVTLLDIAKNFEMKALKRRYRRRRRSFSKDNVPSGEGSNAE
jgi:ribonuclease E